MQTVLTTLNPASSVKKRIICGKTDQGMKKNNEFKAFMPQTLHLKAFHR